MKFARRAAQPWHRPKRVGDAPKRVDAEVLRDRIIGVDAVAAQHAAHLNGGIERDVFRVDLPAVHREKTSWPGQISRSCSQGFSASRIVSRVKGSIHSVTNSGGFSERTSARRIRSATGYHRAASPSQRTWTRRVSVSSPARIKD